MAHGAARTSTSTCCATGTAAHRPSNPPPASTLLAPRVRRNQARKFLETMYLPEGGAVAASELVKRGANKKVVKQMMSAH